MKLKEYYTDENKWFQGSGAGDILGNKLNYEYSETMLHFTARAPRLCLKFAIMHCYTDNDEFGRSNVVSDKICKHLNIISISKWNDSPERTFADIKNLVETLDI